MTFTERHDSTDYNVIYEWIQEQSEKYDILEIAYDPYNASMLATMLADDFEMYEVLQRTSHMNEPSKEFERLMNTQRLKHDGNPVLRWNVSCCEIKIDHGGNICPVKPEFLEGANAGAKKIDGVAAAVMAVGRSMLSDEVGGSGYEHKNSDQIYNEMFGLN
jgi:phage terminase large subunit-like protein